MKNSTFTKLFAFMLLFSSICLVSCDKDDDTPEPTPTPLATSALYDTLGWFIQGATMQVEGQGTKMIADPEDNTKMIQAGRLAIRTVIEEAENVLAGDPEMAPFFPTLLAEVGAGNTTGFYKLRETFTDLIQQVVSGQQIYKGLDMVATHNHDTNPRFGSDDQQFANDAIFDQFLGDVVMAMTNLEVPGSVQGQLGAALESTRSDVVQE